MYKNEKKIISIVGALLLILFFACFNKSDSTETNNSKIVDNKDSKSYTQLLNTNFADKTVAPWHVQANEQGIMVVSSPTNPSQNVMKAHINVKEDFSKLPSGTPRAEILGAGIKLENDLDYIITFKTYLPSDFQVETLYSNPHIFFQVHQNLLVGSPQLALMIEQHDYKMTSNSSPYAHSEYKPVVKNLGSIKGDLGKWVEWIIFYKPSYSEMGRVVILKDRQPVLNYTGVTAYKDVTSYLKCGVYKWAWQKSPTTTTDITTYFSDIRVYKKK